MVFREKCSLSNCYYKKDHKQIAPTFCWFKALCTFLFKDFFISKSPWPPCALLLMCKYPSVHLSDGQISHGQISFCANLRVLLSDVHFALAQISGHRKFSLKLSTFTNFHTKEIRYFFTKRVICFVLLPKSKNKKIIEIKLVSWSHIMPFLDMASVFVEFCVKSKVYTLVCNKFPTVGQ